MSSKPNQYSRYDLVGLKELIEEIVQNENPLNATTDVVIQNEAKTRGIKCTTASIRQTRMLLGMPASYERRRRAMMEVARNNNGVFQINT